MATTNKRTHDRGRGGTSLVFFLSRSCVSVYRCIEQVQGFFLATPGLSGQWPVASGQWSVVWEGGCALAKTCRPICFHSINRVRSGPTFAHVRRP